MSTTISEYYIVKTNTTNVKDDGKMQYSTSPSTKEDSMQYNHNLLK
jgi:hypothetical protein